MDESTLVARARDGDDDAWAELVGRHQAMAFRLAYLHTGNTADAEDVAQESFLSAYQALHRFDPTRPLRPWLLSIVANRARNRRRALGRYWAAVQRWLVERRTDPIAAPSPDVEQSWEARTLWAAVQCLRPIDQEIIYLRFFLELSEAESAEMLGIAVGTAKSRLHRALARLRAVVAREFPALLEGVTDGPAVA